MRTIEIKVYQFNELSDSAKQHALNKYLQHEDFSYLWDDAISTIRAFCDRTSIRTSRNSWAEPSFSHIDDAILELSGVRLRTYFLNNFDFLYKRRYIKHFDCHKNHKNIVNKTAQSTGRQYSFYKSRLWVDDTCCVLTGMCYDDDFLRPIYNFLRSPNNNNFEDVIYDCFHSLVKTVEYGIELNSTMDSFEEHCAANDYEFDERGNRI